MMEVRRIDWKINLTYNTKIEQFKKICFEIEAYIKDKKNLPVDLTKDNFVKVSELGSSSIDLRLICHTDPVGFVDFSDLKEKLIAIQNVKESSENIKKKHPVAASHSALAAFGMGTISAISFALAGFAGWDRSLVMAAMSLGSNAAKRVSEKGTISSSSWASEDAFGGVEDSLS